MEKLLEKLEQLRTDLEKEEVIKEIKDLNTQLNTNEKLLKLLKDYQNYPTETLKKEIINYPLFQKYKEKETDINILILEINQKLKIITKKDKCQL